MDISVMLIFGLIAIASLVILWREGLIRNERRLLIAIFCVAAAFIIRAMLLDYRSGDYNTFLVHWVDYYRQHGGFEALKDSLGNYNLPYLYFLCLFSYSDISDLYLIKLLSIAFDVVLAFSAMKLTGVFTDSKGKRLAAFLITLLLPTVILNGAKWGQCDSIYVSLALISLWLVMTDRPKSSMVFIALSFAFKLQAVFIMPVYLVMLFAKKLKWTDYLIFPLTYIITVLPAVIAGRPVADAVLLYFNQAQTVGSGLNYNSPSLWALIKSGSPAALSAVGIALTFVFVFFILLRCWMKRKALNNEALLFVTLLFVVGIPFLLPHMHDRYFFMADVLLLVPAVIWPQYTPIALFGTIASGLCYYSYLNGSYLYPIQFGTIALIGALIVLSITTASKLGTRCFDRTDIY